MYIKASTVPLRRAIIVDNNGLLKYGTVSDIDVVVLFANCNAGNENAGNTDTYAAPPLYEVSPYEEGDNPFTCNAKKYERPASAA